MKLVQVILIVFSMTLFGCGPEKNDNRSFGLETHDQQASDSNSSDAEAQVSPVDDEAIDTELLFSSEILKGVILEIENPITEGKGKKTITTQSFSISQSNSLLFTDFELISCLENCKKKSPLTEFSGDLSIGKTVVLFGTFSRVKGKKVPQFIAISMTEESVFNDVQPVLPPTDLVAAAQSDTAIDLSWTPSKSQVMAYKIYRNKELVGQVGGSLSSYSDTGLAPTTSYSYAVSAINAQGVESIVAGPVSIATLDVEGQVPVVLDGAKLYADNCASCHGALANSQKAGASAASIEASRAFGFHGSWANALSKDEVAAIAAALK